MCYTTYMLEKVLYWAAGFVDADGSLYVWTRPGYSYMRALRDRYYSPVVTGTNTDPGPVQLLHRLFGGQLRLNKRSAKHLKKWPNAKDYWEWKVIGTDAIAAAHWLEPMLVRKGEQARLIQSWPMMKSGPSPQGNDAVYARQQELYEQLCSLNHRGRD